jgi:hypothetical protein
VGQAGECLLYGAATITRALYPLLPAQGRAPVERVELPFVLGVEGEEADERLVCLAVAGVAGSVASPQSLELGSVLGPTYQGENLLVG